MQIISMYKDIRGKRLYLWQKADYCYCLGTIASNLVTWNDVPLEAIQAELELMGLIQDEK